MQSRNFNRVKFKEPLKASMKLVTASLKTDQASSNETTIYVVDMGAGGLKFFSQSDMEVDFLTIYRFSINIYSKDVILYGRIIRKRNFVKGLIEYGVKLIFDYNEYKDKSFIVYNSE